MAKLVICAVYDAKVGAYMRPMFVPSRGVAIRSFQDEVARNADDNIMFKHPEDFRLCVLGSFDDEIGKFESDLSDPSLLVDGLSVTK